MKKATKTDRKVDWLIKHKHLWVGFPQSIRDLNHGFYMRLDIIVADMRKLSLYANGTNKTDIYFGVFRNIQRARKKIRTGAWRK